MSTGLRFTLEVDGLPPDAFAVVSFHLNQSLSSLFSLDLSQSAICPNLLKSHGTRTPVPR